MNVKLPKSMYVSKSSASKILEAIGTQSAWIDFNSVQVANADFADALFGGIYERYRDNENIYVGLRNVNMFIYTDLQRSVAALRERHQLKNFGFICVDESIPPRRVDLFGAIQPTVGVAWTLTKQNGQLAPGMWRIRDGSKLTLAAYSTYLKEGFNARLLTRKGSREEGGYTYYLPPLPEMV